MKLKFEVENEVWCMDDNAVQKKYISYIVVYKDCIIYHLAQHKLTLDGSNVRIALLMSVESYTIKRKESQIFATKQELIDSIYDKV